MVAAGEVLNLSKSIRVRGAVETWLGSVESGMFEAVRKHLRQGMKSYNEHPLNEWVLKNPGQVVLSVVSSAFPQTSKKTQNLKNPTTALLRW